MKKPGQQRTTITAADFEAAMKRYAAAEEREASVSHAIEEEVEEVMNRYHDELATLAQAKSDAYETIYEYCTANKSTLFVNRRSIGTLHGIAGFRSGTPRLKTARSKSWDKVMKELKVRLPDYIRVTEEPAKDKLIADRNNEKVAPLLIQIGLEIVQDELFYIKTKAAA